MSKQSPNNQREAGIIRTSVIGIAANVALAAFKAVVGLVSNSIAIVLDAVNNLSDAMSSLITILGTKLAAKQADHRHPFGYGRIEYMTTIVIAVIVLWAGISSLFESVARIVEPEVAHYDTPTLLIVGVAVVAKLALGSYVKAKGETLNSDSLVASGEDARLDAIVSASTLIAALINLFFGVGLEAWLGIVIAGLIIKAGLEILSEAIDKILGQRVDAKLSVAVKQAVQEVEHVEGAYDLIMTDYGPNRLMGSIHVEVDESLTAREIDTTTRAIQKHVLETSGVILHTVGVYSKNADGSAKDAARIASELELLKAQDPLILEIHGLYVDETAHTATFDIVVSFEASSREAVKNDLVEKLKTTFPSYQFFVTLDSDISD